MQLLLSDLGLNIIELVSLVTLLHYISLSFGVKSFELHSGSRLFPLFSPTLMTE